MSGDYGGTLDMIEAKRLARERTQVILDSHVANGIIKIENSEYIGIASDGIEVILGCEGRDILRYLALHPNQADW